MVILAAVSGKHKRDHVIEVGHDLATAHGEELVVLNVMEQERFEKFREGSRSGSSAVAGGRGKGGIPYVRAGRSPPNYNLETAMSDAEDVAAECVSNMLSAGERKNVTPRGRVGDPATEIVEEAKRIDARYLVVGGRKRTPTGKAIFGSVAQSVILNSELPVMTVIREGD